MYTVIVILESQDENGTSDKSWLNTLLLQGCTKRTFPGCVIQGWKACVLLPAEFEVIWKAFESTLSHEIWWPHLLKGVSDWQTKMKRDACRLSRRTSLCKSVCKTMLEWCENSRCLSLSTVSMSWVCFHTSSGRGHSGLLADRKIRNVV